MVRTHGHIGINVVVEDDGRVTAACPAHIRGRMSFRIRYTNPRLDHPGAITVTDHLAGIGAEVEVTAHGRLVVEEYDFPIALLARDLRTWRRGGGASDFVLVADMFYETPGAIAFHRTDAGWIVSSSLEDTEASAPMPVDWIYAATDDFLRSVKQDCARLSTRDPASYLGY
ncbi:hypothetical protein ACFUMH_01975 [Cellulomonas sp. NPDC057328]|uniref:DUF7878 domain-containing protein n=1 Tax=Cellulomonas sp. NPDC057328 TaxID=3346101 RepID=UPI00363244FC